MATAAQSYAIVAAATGLNPNTIDRTARALRETGRGLWVVGGPGGGKNAAQVELFHLFKPAPRASWPAALATLPKRSKNYRTRRHSFARCRHFG